MEHLQQQAPPLVSREAKPSEWARLTARRIAGASDPLRELARCKQEQDLGARLERLALPVDQLTYRECHDAAAFYDALFRLVQHDARLEFGNKTIQCLKQYIKLAGMHERVWRKLESGGIPVPGDRTVPFVFADQRGDGLTLFEYHNGYYCVHLWYGGGHQYTSFVVSPDCDLEYATLDLAARIVEDALGRPDSTDEAVRFLREGLRVLPYESKVVRTVRDIPPPEFSRFGKEDAERKMAEWQAFVEGIGRSITLPKREEVFGGRIYTVFVYRPLGGQVIRYQLEFRDATPVQIKTEAIARWVGNCWGIM